MLTGRTGFGLITSSNFFVPQVNLPGSMVTFVRPAGIPVPIGKRSGLGQADITGGICMDASGNAAPCPGVIQPPATGSGYQQSASGSILVGPGPLPGTPDQWSLSIPGVPGPPSTGSGSGSGSGSDLCHKIFGTGNFGNTFCSGWFWLALLVVGGIVVVRVIQR